MKRRNLKKLLVLFVLFMAVGVYPLQAASPLDLYYQIESPEQRLYFRTAIARPDGRDMVYYWKGSVYLSVPGDVFAPPYPGAPGNYYAHGGGNGGTPLFGFEGYNIRRVVPYVDPETGLESDTDFIMATREIVFYTDPATGEVLDEWTNPLTGKTTPVIPVLNEYLFTRYRVENGELLYVGEINFPVAPDVCQSMEFTGTIGTSPEIWGKNYAWYADVFPRYRLNDCGRYGIDDPMNLKDGKYTSTEIFDFYTPKHYMRRILREDRPHPPRGRWVPKTSLTWVREGPTLPWMCMSEEEYPLRVEYHVRSELLRSWHQMPEDFKAKMEAYDYPLGGLDFEGWQQAPETYIPDRPNDTSWSIFYSKVLEPADQTWAEWCASYD
jgi:hypothetical protein